MARRRLAMGLKTKAFQFVLKALFIVGQRYNLVIFVAKASINLPIGPLIIMAIMVEFSFEVKLDIA
jgi:hypothetical protein